MVKIRKSPGVYVEEVSNLAPSVASVATAIPAFVGCTEKGPQNDPVAITSYLEYKATFGEGPDYGYENGNLTKKEYVMANAIRMYFDNGGGKCYIVSIGDYTQNPSVENYTDGLDKVRGVDEVTLLACPDAGMLLEQSDLGDVHVAMLKQAGETMDRFAILDAVGTDADLTSFKEKLSGASDYISYGAAYYPNLKHSYQTEFSENTVAEYLLSGKASLKDILKLTPDEIKTIQTTETEFDELEAEKKATFNAIFTKLNITKESDKTVKNLRSKVASITNEDIAVLSCYSNLKSDDSAKVKMAKNDDIYKSAIAKLRNLASEITPSGAIVGAIVRTDTQVGVWKAPANTGLASVADVTKVVTTSEQDDLNIDADTGYSINCIRKFFGKGFLIWGARTLDGLDNEWRYIPVRRLFNYIEESVQKSTMWAVFEPNDTNTWVKVKCQISNFLTTLWRQGALVGATPDDAYFVNVGVPTTMTTDDVLNGRLIVEVGIAASRPAEFITLVFSHKMEQ